METSEKKLVDVRCIFKKKDKRTNSIRTCNLLCVRVYPPSSGEAYCSSCKLAFEYEVTNQAVTNTSIKVKTID